MKKFISTLLIIVLFLSISGTRQTVQAGTSTWLIQSASPNKVDPFVQQKLDQMQAGSMMTVILTLKQKANLANVTAESRALKLQGVINALQATANETQGRLKRLLISYRSQGLVEKFNALWIINGISITATSDVINELALDPDVLTITPDEIQITHSTGIPEPNIGLINTPALWNQGFYGQGIVVASMDSGVDLFHPELFSSWRGGTNSWFDPYNQHPTTPTDLSGHGTWTTGIMVAGDGSGTSIGVAPSAKWISVKIFNDQGGATATAIHQGFQWLLDPDGDPSTADAPQVVNNSWTFANPGCNLEFESDLQSLRAANILPVFAAGNGGPYGNSSYSPSNNPSAFSVGATNNLDQIYTYSSRGPNNCGGSSGPYPELVAPGVNILTTDLFASYLYNTGTSFAAPHVAGGLALLLSAFPDLNAYQQEQTLINSAVDLGAIGPDDVFGYGRLDLLAAFTSLQTAPTSTPLPTTATPTPTNTLLPATATFTMQPPTLTFTSTNTPTATPTPLSPTLTFTPTSTQLPATPTNTSPPVTGDLIYLSSSNNGTIAGLAFNDEDILAFNPATGSWSLYFDGSDVGISGDINAFALMPDGSLLISLDAPANLPTIGSVDDSDIFRFIPTSLGDNTTGGFSAFLTGSNAGLTSNAEDIDSVDFAPDGSLLISTTGSYNVPAVSGTDEDLITLNPDGVSWSLYFDGSDVGLNDTASEGVNGIWIDPANNQVYLTTLGPFNVTGLSGSGTDIFICTPASLGDTTACTFSSFWIGSANGFSNGAVDAFDIVRGINSPTPTSTSVSPTATPTLTNTPLPATATFTTTNTPIPATPTNTPHPPTATPTPTNTPLLPTATFTPTITLIPATPTNTPFPSTVTPTPTNTPLPATATFTPSSTSVSATSTNTPPPSTATFTPLPPTDTTTPTNTPLPPTATFTPTSTQLPATPTNTPPLVTGDMIYLSSSNNGTISGLTFNDEDILAFDPATGAWSLFFDGSDVGISGDINAFALMPDGSLLISLDAPANLPTIGSVDDSDIFRFIATSLGDNTTGEFSAFLTGSIAGLTSNAEDIDSVDFAPDGSLLISTTGSYNVPAVSGTDEDLITLNPDGVSWSLYFDGSDVGLNDTASEGVNGVWVNPANNQVYLTTLGPFNVTGLSGSGTDIFICTPLSLGDTTACTFSSFWIGSANGFSNGAIDAFDITGY